MLEGAQLKKTLPALGKHPGSAAVGIALEGVAQVEVSTIRDG